MPARISSFLRPVLTAAVLPRELGVTTGLEIGHYLQLCEKPKIVLDKLERLKSYYQTRKNYEKKKHDIVQVLDPEDVTDLTDAQKELYISLGYQPCLLSSGKIKWLNQGQQVSTLVRPQGWSRLIPKKRPISLPINVVGADTATPSGFS